MMQVDKRLDLASFMKIAVMHRHATRISHMLAPPTFRELVMHLNSVQKASALSSRIWALKDLKKFREGFVILWTCEDMTNAGEELACAD